MDLPRPVRFVHGAKSQRAAHIPREKWEAHRAELLEMRQSQHPVSHIIGTMQVKYGFAPT